MTFSPSIQNGSASALANPIGSHWAQSALTYFKWLASVLADSQWFIGSYGACPRPVYEASQRLCDQIEANPDRFIRITLASMMVDVRKRLAKFINAPDVDDIVLVSNASHGFNTVLHNIDWKSDDIIIGCKLLLHVVSSLIYSFFFSPFSQLHWLVSVTTTYHAFSVTLQRYADAFPGLQVQTITLEFPTTPEAIISRFSDHVANLQRKPGAKVVAIIDGIISIPGVWLPWEELVKICRENNVLSVVDAAHVIGQVPLDLKRADPDFLITVGLFFLPADVQGSIF